MRDWAASRSRWLFERGLALALAAGCGDGRETSGSAVTVVAGHSLDASVVDMIATRDAVSPEEAHAHALETLRLAAAFEESARAEAVEAVLLDPARERHLLRSARARLWLSQDFEPRHRAQDVPDQLVEQNLVKPGLFHPQLHAICMAIVMPAGIDPQTGRRALPPDDAQWWARADRHLRPIEERLRRYLVDPGAEPGCEFFAKVVRHAQAPDEQLHVEIEQGGYPVCERELWDPGFVDALCGKLDAPGWVGPFRTRFGLHLAAVIRIEPANLPDTERRRAIVRERVHPQWQRQAFTEYLERLRAKRTVRFRSDLAATEADEPSEAP